MTLAARRLRADASATGRGPAAVFLDRDGVLNDPVGQGSPRSVGDVRLAAGAPEAVERLRRAGYLLVVVTNQPDVARGHLDEHDALAITRAVIDPLALDDAYVCMHDAADGCPCRKPLPGLLTAAVADWGIALGESWLIGDRWVDVVAGRDAGVRTVLLRGAHSDDPSGGVPPPDGLEPDLEVATLDAAVSAIVGTSA